ncbi:Zinc ion binding, putative isoform 1 [Capsicum annuum]|nr:Zinc ion binding, putative isoform 1 [Capsicum annuum]
MRPGGTSQEIALPLWKWEMINMDFIIGLPRSRNQYDSKWVIVDRLTKSAHFLSVRTNYSGEVYAKIYIEEIVRLHGTPVSIISDRGTQVNLSTAFHPQTDGQSKRTIQTLEDMLRACIIDFKGSWVDHLPLVEFAYNNSYHASIKMAPFEALYGRRSRSPIGWYEVGETQLYGPDLVYQAMEKVKIIRERLKTAQSHQKSYADVQRRELEFEIGDWVFLKVSPMKGVMRFGKRGKLRPRYVGPYQILKMIGAVAYELGLPASLGSFYSVFHVSMLKKCIGDHSMVLPVEGDSLGGTYVSIGDSLGGAYVNIGDSLGSVYVKIGDGMGDAYVVLRNITLAVLEKTILQLPDFKHVDAVVPSIDLPSTSKQECNQSSSDHEFALLRNDVKMVGTSIGDNDSDNSNEKNDETPNVGGTGDDQVNDPPIVGQQNDVVLEVDHISDNLMDDVGKTTDCVGGDVIGHLVDDVGEKFNFVGDCIGGHVDVDSTAKTFKDGAWKNFLIFDLLKFTQSSGKNKDIGEGRNSQVDSGWSNCTDFEVTKFTQPFHDQKKQKESDVAVLSQDELDWSDIPDAKIFKFTQPDKIVATTDATDLVCDNVRKVDATASDNVKGIEENMVAASVMLDETPAIPHRLRKPEAICESPFLSKFDSGCGKVEVQPSKHVENSQPSKCVLSIKNPFVKSITEQINDMKVTLKFNRPVYSDSVNALQIFFDYGVDTVKIKEWLFTLAYPGVPLTDSKLVAAYSELISYFFSCIGFWESRSDGLPVANSFDIRIVDGLPTQANMDCGVFVAAFAEYFLDGLQISNHLDDIDVIRI